MEESSDVLNTSSNSNLRELIMQKLTAAREEKLKQNRSVSNLSNYSKTTPAVVISSGSPWEEEKQLLLSMLEKTQSSANSGNIERKLLDNQINQLTSQVKALQQENKERKSELERLWNKRPGDRAESFLVEELKKLESLSNDREKQLQQEIERLNEKLQKKNDNRENEMKLEMIKLEEKLLEYQENLKEKEKEIERLKRTAKSGKTSNTSNTSNTSSQMNAAVMELKSEKEKLERNLDRTMKMACEKESQLSDEIVKLKTLNSQLVEQRDLKDKELKERIEKHNQEIINLKSKISEAAKKAIEEKVQTDKDKANYDKKIHDLQYSLDNIHKEDQQSEAFSTFHTLKDDLQRAFETISQREAEINRLKETSLQCLDMIPTKEKTTDLKSYIQQIQKDFFDFSQKMKTSEELHIGELAQKNQEISTLQAEISELRHRIVVFDSKKYENELMLVRSDLHKAVAERAHAKKLIISYIRSVQQLEKMIYERQDIDSVQQMFSNEVNRLNDENKSLVEAKKGREEFFENESKQLQITIDSQCVKIQELENRIDATSKIRLKESNDEMKSWIVKNRQLQELNKRIIESMSNIDTKTAQSGSSRKSTQFAKGIAENKQAIKQT